MHICKPMIFYPQFCLDCMRNAISKMKSNPCIWCGSENVINHERKIYKDVKMHKAKQK